MGSMDTPFESIKNKNEAVILMELAEELDAKHDAPTMTEMAAHEFPQAPKDEADCRLALVLPGHVWAKVDTGKRAFLVALPDGEGEVELADCVSVQAVHNLTLRANRLGIRTPHPLAPLVKAWIERPRPVEANKRSTGIMPAPFIKRQEKRTAYLPTLAPADAPGLVPLPDMAYLPGLEPTGRRREIPALLSMFDTATNGRVMRGGADLPLAIFVEALLSVPAGGRMKRRIVGPVTIGEIAGEWLQWDRKHYRATKREGGVALKQALLGINTLAVPVGNTGLWIPLVTRGLEGMRWQDRVAFDALLPEGSDVGAMVDRGVLRVLRKISAPAYRAYLSLCFDFDRHGARNGKLIRPTRPVAMRDAQGRLLSPRGKTVTGPGGIPVKSPYDPRAILTGERELNPARTRYPEYDADALVVLCYPASVYDDAATRRMMQTAGRRAIETVEKAGGCVVEKLGRGKHGLPWRIMPPNPPETA